MPARRIHRQTFSFAAAGTNITSLDAHDLSHAQAINLELDVTTIAGAAGDILDVKLQSTRDGTEWNTRIRSHRVLGNTTAPRYFQYNLQQHVLIAQTEQAYETPDSTGQSEIAAAQVVNGPFPGLRRLTTTQAPGLSMRTNSWRLVFVVTSVGTASFAGTLLLSVTDQERF